MPKLKFRKEYLERLTKPIPKKEPARKDTTMVEVQSQPRHPKGFVQYCTNCGKERTFRVDTLGWKTCTVCHGTAPDRSQSPI